MQKEVVVEEYPHNGTKDVQRLFSYQTLYRLSLWRRKVDESLSTKTNSGFKLCLSFVVVRKNIIHVQEKLISWVIS